MTMMEVSIVTVSSACVPFEIGIKLIFLCVTSEIGMAVLPWTNASTRSSTALTIECAVN